LELICGYIIKSRRCHFPSGQVKDDLLSPFHGSFSHKAKDFEGDIDWVNRKLITNTPHMIVKKKHVNNPMEPNTSSSIVGKANYGVVLATVKQQKGYAKVKHESGLVGWIKRDLLWG